IFNLDPLRGGATATVQPAPGQANPGCPPAGCVGNALVNAVTPDVLYTALRLSLTARTELEAAARWGHYGGRRAVEYSLQGGQLDRLASSPATRIPPDFFIDYGLQDAFGVEVSARFLVRSKLRLSPSLMVESSAVDKSAVNAASIDAPKLDAALTA